MYVVGIGPGGVKDRTIRAEEAIRDCGVIVGYTKYVALIEDLIEGKETIQTGMTKETDRCRQALDRAKDGERVALISSGDAGIYGMAGLAYELADSEKYEVPIEIVPGVTAAISAGALLGAPLMLDFAAISLSDLLVPWEMIKKRIEAVASCDMVTVLYNPKSKKRIEQLNETIGIFRKYRDTETPVGICDSISLEGEAVSLSNLGNVLNETIGMRTTLVIGNSGTKVINGKLVNPRGYKV